MKAAIYRESAKPFVIETVADPVPGPGEVIIKVCRCGICGSDINLTSGTPFDFPTGGALGHEYAGEVVALGSGVTRLKVGDRITAIPKTGCGQCSACRAGYFFHCTGGGASQMGGYGEYTRIAESTSFRLPESLSFADGALVEPLACGSRAVRHGGVGPGVRVLVIGAGAMGMAAVYWSRLMGAENIAVTATSSRRRDLAMTLGARDFVTAGEGLAERVAESLGGPPDVVFECAGAESTIASGIELARLGGTLVVMGACTHSVQFVPIIALGKEVRIQFSLAYDLADFQFTLDALDRGALEPRAMVQDVISLDALPQRLEDMRKPHPQCKVMVDPWL